MNPKELVARVNNLPPASPAAIQLITLLNHRSVSNDDVVQVIRQDSVLTAKLLRACNSSQFAFEEPISSVDQAVFVLGHQEILRRVLTLTLGQAMVAPLPGYAVEANELWEHSLTTALAAERVVTGEVGLIASSGTAFTVGLLHDIGKLVLGQALTREAQSEIRGLIQQGAASRVEAEKKILGTDHAEVGAHLLQLWRLPEDIVEAVAHHHQPVLDPRPRLSVVAHLANCLAHLSGSAPGWEAYAVRVSDEVIAAFEITPEKLEGMVIAVREWSERMHQVIDWA